MLNYIFYFAKCMYNQCNIQKADNQNIVELKDFSDVFGIVGGSVLMQNSDPVGGQIKPSDNKQGS